MLETKKIYFDYGNGEVLKGIDLAVRQGELCAVLGNNGAGKSSLLKCIAGILRPQKGSIYLGEDNSAFLSRRESALRLGYVAQREVCRARITVFDAVLMGRKPHISWGVEERDLQVVEEVIDTLGIEDIALRYIDELSGGEYQKVVIARALAQEPRVMLLDEPTSNLDLRNQLEVLETVREAVEERGISALMAIHDLNLAMRFADTFIFLHNGKVLAAGGHEVLTPENIELTYGVQVEIHRNNGRSSIIPKALGKRRKKYGTFAGQV
jgi:iron complex transport system ATP-binding protein